MITNIYTTPTTVSPIKKRSQPLKLHVLKQNLFLGVQTVQTAISLRSTLPILANILLEATEQGLRLSATDLEVGVRTWVKADIIQTGAMTVPAKIFSDFLRTLEDDREIKIEVLENNRIEVRSGKDRLNVTGLPREDYPVLPEFNEEKAATISSGVLYDMVKKTVFSTSTDETRYVLNGVHFVVDQGKITAVATDGRRLSHIQRTLPDTSLQAKIIIPTKAIQELLRLLPEGKNSPEPIKVSFTDNQASFLIGSTVILSRLIEGHFPNFDQVIPKTHDLQLVINRSALLLAVTRAIVGTLEKGSPIQFFVSKGTIRIQAGAQGRVDVESEITTNYEGPDFDISFNPIYLMDVLKALDQEEIILELSTPLNPGVIKSSNDEHYSYVMMPMKV